MKFRLVIELSKSINRELLQISRILTTSKYELP